MAEKRRADTNVVVRRRRSGSARGETQEELLQQEDAERAQEEEVAVVAGRVAAARGATGRLTTLTGGACEGARGKVRIKVCGIDAVRMRQVERVTPATAKWRGIQCDATIVGPPARRAWTGVRSGAMSRGGMRLDTTARILIAKILYGLDAAIFFLLFRRPLEFGGGGMPRNTTGAEASNLNHENPLRT